MEFALHILGGFVALTDPTVLFYMIVGFLIGTFFGAVPGLTAVLAIALLLPITYSLDVTAALVMCASIFMSGMYAGSITATTINIPGAPSSMMTGVEGYPLMQQGHGANALGHAALGVCYRRRRPLLLFKPPPRRGGRGAAARRGDDAEVRRLLGAGAAVDAAPAQVPALRPLDRR